MNYRAEYEAIKEQNSGLFQSCPEVVGAFQVLHEAGGKEKLVSAKTKELIALGIAVGIRCEGCIISHVATAIKLGATLEEIAETIEVAIYMGGGPSIIYGGKALTCAKQLLGK